MRTEPAKPCVTTKKRVLRRDGYHCQLCGFQLALHVHHILERCNGGTDDMSNLITLCPNHHAMVHLGHIPSGALLALIAEARSPLETVPMLSALTDEEDLSDILPGYDDGARWKPHLV